MIKQIKKEELIDILKQHYGLKQAKIVTVDIGDTVNTLIDDTLDNVFGHDDVRPLTLNIDVE